MTVPVPEVQNSQETRTNEEYIAILEKAATVLQFDTLGALISYQADYEFLFENIYPFTTACNAILHAILAKEHVNDKNRFGYHRNQALSTTARAIALFALASSKGEKKSKVSIPSSILGLKSNMALKQEVHALPVAIFLISMARDLFGYLKQTKNLLFGKRTDPMDMDDEMMSGADS